MPEVPDWEAIVASPFWPQFLEMLAWFEQAAVSMTCVADTESKLYTAQGELRAYHGMQVQIESRARQMKDARERAQAARTEEIERDADVASRRGSAGSAGPRRSSQELRNRTGR